MLVAVVAGFLILNQPSPPPSQSDTVSNEGRTVNTDKSSAPVPESAPAGLSDEAKYREAIRGNANNPEPHYFLGQILDKKGDLDSAIAEYQTAITLMKPEQWVRGGNVSDMRNTLGHALEKKGDRQAALEQYRVAYRFYPWVDSYKGDYERLQAELKTSQTPSGPPDSASARQSLSHFVVSKLTILDVRTNLMWMREDYAILEKRFVSDWNEAIQWKSKVNSQHFASYDDWFVPSIAQISNHKHLESGPGVVRGDFPGQRGIGLLGQRYT
jgi:tetratricopeptide (TPR) repeat protein